MVNWVCRSFESLYEPYVQLHGTHYELTNVRLLSSRAYDDMPEIHGEYQAASEQGLVKRKPLDELVEEPHVLELTGPDKHSELFSGLYR